MRRKSNALASFAFASVFAIIAIVEAGAFAQKASVPKRQDTAALGEGDVRQLMSVFPQFFGGNR